MRPIPINTESDHLLSVTICMDNKEPTNPALKQGLWKTVGPAGVWDRTLPCSREIICKSFSGTCRLQTSLRPLFYP